MDKSVSAILGNKTRDEVLRETSKKLHAFLKERREDHSPLTYDPVYEDGILTSRLDPITVSEAQRLHKEGLLSR